MSVERRSMLRVTDQQAKYRAERDGFNDIKTRMGNLLTEIDPFLKTGTSDLFQKVSAVSSNLGVVTASATTSASAATYDFRVKQLALSESVISKTTPSVGGFTSVVTGGDLNADIDAATTRLGSLHRRDNAANFVDADLGQLMIDDGVTGPINVDLNAGGLLSTSSFQNMADFMNAALSGAGSGVSASVNAAGNGLLLTSTTGNVSVADGGDGRTTATKLGVATAGLVASPVDGGDLDPDLQTDTPLARLNGGAGVADLASGIRIRNGNLNVTASVATATTVDDVLTAINGAGASVTAALAVGGNSLQVTSTIANRSLSIEENGGTTAANLGVFGEDNVIRLKTAADGSFFSVMLNGGHDGDNANLSMSDIRDSVNAVTGRTFAASVVDGRLSIRASNVGVANALQMQDNEAAGGILEQLEMLIINAGDSTTISNLYAGDSSRGGYLQAAQDAVFSIDGVVVQRSKNTGITDVLTGVTLNLQGTSSSTGPAFPSNYASTSLTISRDDDSIANAVERFVNQFNSTVDLMGQLTKINTEGEDGTLSQSSTARTLESGLFRQASQLLPDVGQTYRSLFELRDANGTFVFKASAENANKLEFDKTALKNVLAADRDAVEDVLRYDGNADNVFEGGIFGTMKTFINSYTDATKGIITKQIGTYKDQIDELDEKLLAMSERLDSKDERLKLQFARSEQLLSTLQSQSSYFSSQLASLAGGKR